MQRAFVTGATGLLGNNLVHALRARGVSVVALYRTEAKVRASFGGLTCDPGIRWIKGDMSQPEAFASALEGCDSLFHTAAYFREHVQPGDHGDALDDINVRGTLRLLTLAAKAEIQRVVYVSSIATIADASPEAPADESHPRSGADARNPYYASKIRAETAIDAFLTEHDLHVSLVLPGFMHGPGDLGPTSAGQNILDFVAGNIPGVPPSTVSVVDARDVAEAMIAARDRGRRGERYIVAGRALHMRELYASLARVTGLAAPKIQFPYALMWLYAALATAWARLTGRAALITLTAVRLLSYRPFLSSAKAQRELGVTFRPLDETLADTLEWYRERGMLPA